MFFLTFFMSFCFGRSKKKHQKNVVILGGQNDDIILVFIRFSEMSVFSHVCFFEDFFEKLKG